MTVKHIGIYDNVMADGELWIAGLFGALRMPAYDSERDLERAVWFFLPDRIGAGQGGARQIIQACPGMGVGESTTANRRKLARYRSRGRAGGEQE